MAYLFDVETLLLHGKSPFQETAKRLILNQGINYPVIMGGKKQAACRLQWPSRFCRLRSWVDPEGRVVQKRSGLVALPECDLVIRALLKMR